MVFRRFFLRGQLNDITQVKAGQTISLTDLADAVHREKKKSVVAQLKYQPTQERKKAAPKKSAEKER